MKRLGLICALALFTALALPASAGKNEPIYDELLFNNDSNGMRVGGLDEPHLYKIVVSGKVSDWTSDPDGEWQGEKWGVDALYCYAKWRCGETPQLWRQLQLAGVGFDELVGKTDKIKYDPHHTYSGYFTGRTRLKLTNSDTSMDDNSGYWRIKLFDLGVVRYDVNFSFHHESESSSGLTTTIADGSGRLLIEGELDEDEKVEPSKIPEFSATLTELFDTGGGILESTIVLEAVKTGSEYYAPDSESNDSILHLQVRVKSSTSEGCPKESTGIVSLFPERVEIALCGNNYWERPDSVNTGHLSDPKFHIPKG